MKPGEVDGAPFEGGSVVCEPLAIDRGFVGKGEDGSIVLQMPFGPGGWTAVRMSGSVAADLAAALQTHAG